MNAFDFDKLKVEASKIRAEAKPLFKKLNKGSKSKLDDIFQFHHQEAFKHIDCLECANCCRSLGPRITDKDIERIAKHLRKKPSEIMDEYLCVDEDNDIVFKTMPCPFLLPDNYCMIYESRPKACREYPHTDRKRIYQALTITLKNMDTCPAVTEVVKGVVKDIQK